MDSKTHRAMVEARCAATEKKGKCQMCGVEKETKVIAFWIWRVEVCEKCENKARKNVHIK